MGQNLPAGRRPRTVETSKTLGCVFKGAGGTVSQGGKGVAEQFASVLIPENYSAKRASNAIRR